jgi:hypothetical protein
MNTPLTVTRKLEVARVGVGGRQVVTIASPAPVLAPTVKIPRIARLMALAIKLDAMIREGTVKDQAEIARLGHVSRARVSQILSLLNFAPDLQEKLLFLQLTDGSLLILADLYPIVAEANWAVQRALWARLPLTR